MYKINAGILNRFFKIEIHLHVIYDCMCNYVKIRVDYNRGQPDHIILYKTGRIICRHDNNTSCIQLDDDKYPLTKSAHSKEPNVFYIHDCRIDTIPYSLYPGQDCLSNIRNKLSNLKFHIVGSVTADEPDLRYVRRYQYHPTKLSTYDYVDDMSKISLLDNNVRLGYNKYSGTTRFGQVGFDMKKHAYLQMSGLMIGSFVYVENYEPPVQNSMICGYIDNKNQFTHWFHCSNQFYMFYLLIKYGKEHEVFAGKNQNQILDMLETNRNLKIVEKPDVKAKKYIHLDLEPAAVNYCDIYKSMALVFYFQSDQSISNRHIPEHYRIPSHHEIYLKSLLDAFG